MTPELAQRLKAAALKAKHANDLYLEGKITLSECVVETKDHLDYSDNPNNTLALVEALEAAEKRNAEYRAALNNLAAVARRYLPDYDEHPEIQAADKLLESAAGAAVEGE